MGWAGAEGPKGSPAQKPGGAPSKPLASLYSGTSWPGVGMRAGAGVESAPVCGQMPGVLGLALLSTHCAAWGRFLPSPGLGLTI